MTIVSRIVDLLPGGGALQTGWAFVSSPIGRLLITGVVAGYVGWHARARLDEGVTLRAQLETARAEIATKQKRIERLETDALSTQLVAHAATQREKEADDRSRGLEQQVSQYEELLKKRGPVGACAIDGVDMRSVQHLSGARARHKRPGRKAAAP